MHGMATHERTLYAAGQNCQKRHTEHRHERTYATSRNAHLPTCSLATSRNAHSEFLRAAWHRPAEQLGSAKAFLANSDQLTLHIFFTSHGWALLMPCGCCGCGHDHGCGHVTVAAVVMDVAMWLWPMVMDVAMWLWLWSWPHMREDIDSAMYLQRATSAKQCLRSKRCLRSVTCLLNISDSWSE